MLAHQAKRNMLLRLIDYKEANKIRGKKPVYLLRVKTTLLEVLLVIETPPAPSRAYLGIGGEM